MKVQAAEGAAFALSQLACVLTPGTGSPSACGWSGRRPGHRHGPRL